MQKDASGADCTERVCVLKNKPGPSRDNRTNSAVRDTRLLAYIMNQSLTLKWQDANRNHP